MSTVVCVCMCVCALFIILVPFQGRLMAVRVFDTYIPGSEESLVSFLNSISSGRVLCMAILVSTVSARL